MVGMPYPNPADVELRERMAFMDAAAAAAAAGGSGVVQPTASSRNSNSSPGQQYYQDLCMKVCSGACAGSTANSNVYLPAHALDSKQSNLYIPF
jgi:hypothetical protein